MILLPPPSPPPRLSPSFQNFQRFFQPPNPSLCRTVSRLRGQREHGRVSSIHGLGQETSKRIVEPTHTTTLSTGPKSKELEVLPASFEVNISAVERSKSHGRSTHVASSPPPQPSVFLSSPRVW